MQAFGILFGIIMLVSVFFPWEAYTGSEGLWLRRISTFLGIDLGSFDRLFHLDFLTVVCPIILIVGMALEKKHLTWRIVALVGSLICAVVGTYNVLYYLFIIKESYYVPGTALWIYAIVSLLTLVISIIALTNKSLFEKKLSGKVFDASN